MGAVGQNPGLFFCRSSLCIFCGKRDEAFTEDQLDLHYWKHCPMLRRCEECRQVGRTLSHTAPEGAFILLKK